MTKVTLEDVRNRCAEGRFYAYDCWRDRFFVPPSIWLVWFFVRIGLSGNQVSLLSGAFAIIGGFMMAAGDGLTIAMGSFGYIIFYLLDYVDGGVARFNRKAGIGGQYVDLIMHLVAAVATMAGLFAGAIISAGSWIMPFGIGAMVASALALGNYSCAWFAICMLYQQKRVSGNVAFESSYSYQPRKRFMVYDLTRKCVLAIYHENYAIFLLPILALTQLFLPLIFPDFRVVLIFIGGTVYLPIMVLELWLMAEEGRVDNAYKKLFCENQTPNLPEDHFFK